MIKTLATNPEQTSSITNDQLQNEILTIGHHLSDVMKALDKGDIEHAKTGLTDVIEAMDRLAEFLPRSMSQEVDRMAEDVIRKIDEGTATENDFQVLLDSMPETVRDRVRRTTTHGTAKMHQDEDGHAKLEGPTFKDRIHPKRERAGRTQNNGRGRSGHRRSAKTQKRTMPTRFDEAMGFITSNIGTDVSSLQLEQVNNKPLLLMVARRLMSVPNIDRDWFHNLCNALSK